MEKLIKQLKDNTYKGRFSIYHKEDVILLRTYNSDGTQQKFTGTSIKDVLLEAIKYHEVK